MNRPELVVQSRVDGTIGRIAFSPDGKTLASASTGVALWDVESGWLLRDFRGFRNFIDLVIFSPDGKTLAARELKTGFTKVWNVATGKVVHSSAPDRPLDASELLGRILEGKEISGQKPDFISFSPDGKMFASVSKREGKGLVTLQDSASGNFIRQVAGDFRGFSPDGQLLAAQSEQTAYLWDVASGKLVQSLEGSFWEFSPNGNFVISSKLKSVGGKDTYNFSLWRVGNSGPLFRFEGEFEAPVGILEQRIGSKYEHAGFQAIGAELEGKRLPLNILPSADGAAIAYVNVESKGTNVLAELAYSTTLWSGTNGKLISRFPGHIVALSPDGRMFVSRINRGVRLHDAAGGRVMYELNDEEFVDVDFASGLILTVESPAKSAATESANRQDAYSSQLVQRDVYSGQLVRKFDGSYFESRSLSADGKKLALGDAGDENEIAVWDTAGGKLLITLKENHSSISSADIRPGGKSIRYLRVAESATFETIDLQSGAPLSHRLEGEKFDERGSTTTFSPDGKTIASARWGPAVTKLWDATTGRLLHTLDGDEFIAFSPDGRLFVSVEEKMAQEDLVLFTVKLRETTSGKLIRSFGEDRAACCSLGAPAAFSPDGTLIAVGSTSGDASVSLWETQSGRLIRKFTDSADKEKVNASATRVVFSRDGKRIASWREYRLSEGEVKLWDVASGELTHRAPAEDSLADLAFSPDGAALTVVYRGGNTYNGVAAWNLSSGEQIVNEFDGYYSGPFFSPDGKALVAGILTGVGDHLVKLWSSSSGEPLRSFKDHSSVDEIAFLSDGKMMASGGGTIRLLTADTGELLATLFTFGKDDWLVVAPDGLFDGSPAAYDKLIWRFSNNTFDVAPVEAFFNEYYYPGLLGDILAGRQPKAAQDIALIDRRQPRVSIASAERRAPANAGIARRSATVRVEAAAAPADKDRPNDSGVRDIRLFRNGSLVKVWRGDAFALSEKDGCRREGRATVVCEATVPIVVAENRFTAYAFNRDNVKSRDASLVVMGAESLRRPGTLYVLAVGVDEYANPNLNLDYAVSDVQEFGKVLRAEQERLGQYASTQIVRLTNREATKANILLALSRFAASAGEADSLVGAPQSLKTIKPSQPEDGLVIFFAGHGAAHGDRFYLLTHNFGSTRRPDGGRLEPVRAIRQYGVSDEEIEAALEKVDAGKMVMIIDACNSGQALEAADRRRGPVNSKGLAQLAYEKGMYVMTASQSYQAALEATRLGSGLLTYALVRGMEGARADVDADGSATARELFNYATEQVPRLQLEEMKKREADIRKGLRAGKQRERLAFVSGDEKVADPERRNVQLPRVFYRRELEALPLIVARRAAGRH